MNVVNLKQQEEAQNIPCAAIETAWLTTIGEKGYLIIFTVFHCHSHAVLTRVVFARHHAISRETYNLRY
jgi:hypothetical protein